MSGILSDLRVLDLSRGIAGPMTGMMLHPPAIPETPSALFAIAAATPAQAVPCPGEAELSSGLVSLSPQS